MYDQKGVIQLLKYPDLKEARLAKLEAMEDGILDRANGILDAALSFDEIDEQDEDPPEEWVAKYGEKVARRRLRVAKSACLPAKEAPMGLRLAAQVKTGIDRAKSNKVSLQGNTINVQMLTLPAPTTQEHPGATEYKVIDVESDK